MNPIQKVAAMVVRVDRAAAGTQASYTPGLRELERQVDAAAPDELDGRLKALETGWNVEISRARREGAAR